MGSPFFNNQCAQSGVLLESVRLRPLSLISGLLTLAFFILKKKMHIFPSSLWRLSTSHALFLLLCIRPCWGWGESKGTENVISLTLLWAGVSTLRPLKVLRGFHLFGKLVSLIHWGQLPTVGDSSPAGFFIQWTAAPQAGSLRLVSYSWESWTAPIYKPLSPCWQPI